jgi:hypothetical protein
MLIDGELVTNGVGLIKGFKVAHFQKPFLLAPGVTLTALDAENEGIRQYLIELKSQAPRIHRNDGIYVLYDLGAERKLKWAFELETILWDLALAVKVLSPGFAYSAGALYYNSQQTPTTFYSPFLDEKNSLIRSDVVVEEADLPTLVGVYEKIATLGPLHNLQSEGFSRLRNALRFYDQAVNTDWHLLKIVLLFICLESLFSDQQDKSDISYKVRLRGARFLADDLAQRKQIFDDLKTGYEIRSTLLHGANVAAKIESNHSSYEYPEILQEYARKTLLKIMTTPEIYLLFSGKPNQAKEKEFFDRLVL